MKFKKKIIIIMKISLVRAFILLLATNELFTCQFYQFLKIGVCVCVCVCCGRMLQIFGVWWYFVFVYVINVKHSFTGMCAHHSRWPFSVFFFCSSTMHFIFFLLTSNGVFFFFLLPQRSSHDLFSLWWTKRRRNVAKQRENHCYYCVMFCKNWDHCLNRFISNDASNALASTKTKKKRLPR